jgi:P4 family phage/plasmid primase-like protien
VVVSSPPAYKRIQPTYISRSTPTKYLTYHYYTLTIPSEGDIMAAIFVDKVTAGIDIDLSWCTNSDTRFCTERAPVMGDLIMHFMDFACDKAKRLFYYHEGVYKEGGDTAVEELYMKILLKLVCHDAWNASLLDRVIRYITSCVPYILDQPELCKINMLNGVYDWSTEQFSEPDSSYRTVVQIPITYDPEAECPGWDKFLSEVCPEGVQLMQEIIGLCMIPFTGLQKCIVLVGEGSNGKGVFISGLTAAIGRNNICNVPLQKLSGNLERFNTAALVGKLANIFNELSTKAIEDTANFKALTGEDTIMVEYKNKQPYSYTPFTRLIFSCNKVVKAENDNSMGYKRRFIHIPFMRTFTVDPKIGSDIKDTLSSPKELSGLFNKIRKLIPSIVENGFTITPEIAAIVDNFCPIPPTTRAWLVSNIIEDEKGAIPTNAFYNYYVHNCPCCEPFERGKLITYMKNTFPSVRAHHSVRIWRSYGPFSCYKGVRMIDSDLDMQIKQDAAKLATKLGLHDDLDNTPTPTN